MLNLFKSNYTKWIPLGSFSFQSKDYITYVKKNLKTGMMKFKTKRVNTFLFDSGCVDNVFTHNSINVQEAWEEITK